MIWGLQVLEQINRSESVGILTIEDGFAQLVKLPIDKAHVDISNNKISIISFILAHHVAFYPLGFIHITRFTWGNIDGKRIPNMANLHTSNCTGEFDMA